MDIFQTQYINGKGWLEPLPDYNSPQTLILVFGGADYLSKPEPFQQLYKKYPDSIIAGCSTPAGVIGKTIARKGLVVSITRFWSTRLAFYAVEKRENEGSIELAHRIAKKINEESLVAIMTFSDGLSMNGSQYMEGINQVVGDHVVVTGGLAANSGNGNQSWVLKDATPTLQTASVIGFYGDSVTVMSSKGSGWKAFGPKRKITKSHQETLYELDGKPALQLYKNYLGEAAGDLPESGLLYPLSIWSGNSEDNTVRSIMSIDEDAQSISFAGDMPQGTSTQLMYGTLENLIEGAEQAVDDLSDIHTHSPGMLSIVASCIGRLLVLDEDVEMEVEAVLEKLPYGAKQIGFYSAGEFATHNDSRCSLHNETLTLTVIYEK